MNLKDSARALAEALIESGQVQFTDEFPVTQYGMRTKKRVRVVVVVEEEAVTGRFNEAIFPLQKSAHSLLGSGTNICPSCLGTGRI